MAQYKVPQDVEAEDKLLGPFTFRQFVYLLIVGGLVAIAVGLFQIFPALALIPVPFILLFGALALPLKKDQPMETYLAALVSYYLKPRTKIWHPGQRETVIEITAPKIVEETRSRDISGEEATNRLSFLAEIVDTEGRAIKNGQNSNMRDDLAAEASTAEDMFENHHFDNLKTVIEKDENARHAELVENMKASIAKVESIVTPSSVPTVSHHFTNEQEEKKDIYQSKAVVRPIVQQPVTPSAPQKTVSEKPVKPSIIELANDKDLSVATIAKEAKRINRKEDGEVFISLH